VAPLADFSFYQSRICCVLQFLLLIFSIDRQGDGLEKLSYLSVLYIAYIFFP
jgi:hypothetical protein